MASTCMKMRVYSNAVTRKMKVSNLYYEYEDYANISELEGNEKYMVALTNKGMIDIFMKVESNMLLLYKRVHAVNENEDVVAKVRKCNIYCSYKNSLFMLKWYKYK